MSFCQNLIQSLNNWKRALEEFRKTKDQYLEKFSEKEKENLNEKRKELQKAKEEYFQLKEQSYQEIEIEAGKTEKLFGPEYEALKRLYQGCGLRLLEKGEIAIEKGRLIGLSLYNLASKDDTPQILQQRTQAFREIRRFLKLTELDCSSNNLLELDPSQNTKLEVLRCYSNQLSKLNLGQNKKLIELYCFSNPFPTLDLSQNPELEVLYCEYGLLTTLNLSQNKKLKRFWCEKNFLSQKNCQKIEEMGIKDLFLYPQYPKEILDFLRKLQKEEPRLNKGKAKEKLREYLRAPEIQDKLIPGKIGLPDEENLNRILTSFFKD